MASVGFPVAETWLGGSKRKCVDDIAEEFAEFSLSSPARKIRRLDAFVPPVTIGKGFENGIDSNLAQLPIELETKVHENKLNVEERALVLYKPMNTPPLEWGGSPGVLLEVDHNFIAELKESLSGRLREEAKTGSRASAEADNRLAVVPWVPNRFANGSNIKAAGMQDQQQDSIEVEANAENEPMSMDVEEENDLVDDSQIISGVGPQHWQQHCMSAAPAVNAATPIMWSW